MHNTAQSFQVFPAIFRPSGPVLPQYCADQASQVPIVGLSTYIWIFESFRALYKILRYLENLGIFSK